MNFEINKITTPTGEKRLELRVWNYGPRREERRRRFEDKNALHRALDEFREHEEELFSPKSDQDLTFGDILPEYLKQNFSPGWRKNIDGYLREFGDELREVSVAAINTERLNALETLLKSKGNSQKTVNLKIGSVKSVLNYAFNKEIISENKAARYKLRRAERPSIEFWEREDAEDFLTFTAGKYPRGTPKRWIHVAYLLGVNAGLRAGEIWALKPSCLKTSLGVLRIEEQWDRVSKSYRPPKGKGSRNVPMNDVLRDEIEMLINQFGRGRYDPIFQTEEGNPICHDNFSDRTFQSEFKKWQGPKIKFHGLRHTACTLMFESGIDAKTIQEIMGHKSLTTTLGYAHLIGKNVKLAGEKFMVKSRATVLKAVR